jgi:hypothetical protein
MPPGPTGMAARSGLLAKRAGGGGRNSGASSLIQADGIVSAVVQFGRARRLAAGPL